MNLLQQKPSIKVVIFIAIFILLVCSVYFVFTQGMDNTSEINTDLYLSLSITPTPYPLPTKVYDSPSYLVTVLGQIFNKNKLVNPSLIIQESQLCLSNEYLDLYMPTDQPSINTPWWQEESKQVFAYVSDRLGTVIDEKVAVVFVPPQTGNCAPRGTSYHEEQPIILIYADQDTSKEQILAVLAHELGHIFAHQTYENLNDVALNEGIATWAAKDYWEAWKGIDFDDSVRSYIADKIYLPLSQNYDLSRAYEDTEDCLTNRDILLTELAFFLDYLIEKYGFEKLSSLFDIQQPAFVNDQRIIYQPGYGDVYGAELNQLEYDWLRSLLD